MWPPHYIVNRVFQCVSFVWSNNLLMGHMHAAHTFSSKIRQERVFQEGVQRLENSKPKHLPLTLYLCRCLPWKRNVPRPKKGTAVLQTGATVKPASREKLGKTRYSFHSFHVPSFLWKVTWMIPSTKASTSHTLVTCRSDMDNVFHLVMTQVLHFEGLRGMMILIDSWILVHHYLGFCFFIEDSLIRCQFLLSKSLRLQHLGRVSREWLEHGIGSIQINSIVELVTGS